ncbi:hypothetical protein ACWC0C_19830 [Streptomyces sp. NPDC001709]
MPPDAPLPAPGHRTSELDPVRPNLVEIPASPWNGRHVTAPYRQKGTVRKVYAAPDNVEVALMTDTSWPRPTVRIQVTELLALPGQRSARRAEYFDNERQIRRLYRTGRVGASNRTTTAYWRRIQRFGHYLTALKFVELSLLEQVRAGDELVYAGGIRVVVLDPDLRRNLLGWRDRMRVELTQATRDDPDMLRAWHHDPDHPHDAILLHGGDGLLLPTLGLL